MRIKGMMMDNDDKFVSPPRMGLLVRLTEIVSVWSPMICAMGPSTSVRSVDDVVLLMLNVKWSPPNEMPRLKQQKK